MQTVIFDYDGTLHETMRIYRPAFLKNYENLASRALMPPAEFSDRDISRWLGFPAPEMWRRFAPALSEEERAGAGERIQAEMLRLIREGDAELYPGVPELLTRLKREGFRLLLLSNCRTCYLSAHRSRFGLDRWFCEYFWGENEDWAPKKDILKRILKKYPGPAVMVGDRFHDFEAAESNRLPSVACAYGYGEEAEYRTASRSVPSPELLYEAIRSSFPHPQNSEDGSL